MDENGVSVVVPTVRVSDTTIKSLRSIALAVNYFQGNKELIIAVDRKLTIDDFLYVLVKEFSFIKLLETGGSNGSACTRLGAVRLAKYSVIIFTDDDCIVIVSWVARMYTKVVKYGAVAGNLASMDQKNMYSAIDNYVDQLRIRDKDSNGGAKYISFPNFGIKRSCLPKLPFIGLRVNTTEDIDLACRLRLTGISIYFDESLIVVTEYPKTFSGLLKRKIKHAQGIAFLRYSLDSKNREFLGLAETPWKMLLRWSSLSFKAPFNFFSRICMFLANLSYCVALAYYDKVFNKQNRKELL